MRYIYGLAPTIEGLRLHPCLPPDWRECSITKEFRGTAYEITYRQTGDGNMRITVDGKALNDNLLPYEKRRTYTVEVVC